MSKFSVSHATWPNGAYSRDARVRENPAHVAYPCKATVSVYLHRNGDPYVSHVYCTNHPGLKFDTTIDNLIFLDNKEGADDE